MTDNSDAAREKRLRRTHKRVRHCRKCGRITLALIWSGDGEPVHLDWKNLLPMEEDVPCAWERHRKTRRKRPADREPVPPSALDSHSQGLSRRWRYFTAAAGGLLEFRSTVGWRQATARAQRVSRESVVGLRMMDPSGKTRPVLVRVPTPDPYAPNTSQAVLTL